MSQSLYQIFFVKVCQSIQQTLSKFLTIFEIIPETLSRSLFTGVSATLFHNRGVVCVAIDQLHTASCCCLIAGLNYSLLQCLDLFTGGTGLPGRHSCPPHSTGADHHGGERRASGGAGREDRGPTVAQLQKCADRLQFFCFFFGRVLKRLKMAHTICMVCHQQFCFLIRVFF